MSRIEEEQTIDLALAIAMFRCFHEQLYNLKGVHSQMLKKKFNKLINVARQYEDEIIKSTDSVDEIDIIYDELMDVVVAMKKTIIKETENE